MPAPLAASETPGPPSPSPSGECPSRIVLDPHVWLDVEARTLHRRGRPAPLHEKPWRLLVVLAERRGEVVSREELYQAVWPDTEHLDFEANLNATVRRLRRALGDSARRPRWLETLPGRGYRLRARPEPAPAPPAPDASAATAPSGPEPSESGRFSRRTHRVRRVVTALGVAALLAALGWWVAATTVSSPVRVGIVRFERSVVGTPAEAELTRLGERVLVGLGERSPRLAIVGPRSTFPYEGDPFPHLGDLARDLELDYVLNARAVEGDELVVELISVEDRSHPWVRIYESGFDATRAEREIVEGVAGAVLPGD